MNVQDQTLCKVRTITTFISLDYDASKWQVEIAKASIFCNTLSARFASEGYLVQSIRIVTNPFGEYLNTANLSTARKGLALLSELLKETNQSGTRIRFAIGEAKTHSEIDLLPELIKEFGDLCNACVNVPVDDMGILDDDLILTSVNAVKKISQITPRGEGNFNFTVNFNCQPLIPYFPASYHDSHLGNRFVIGLETPDLLLHALQEYKKKDIFKSHNERFKGFYDSMKTALQHHISTIERIITEAGLSDDMVFSGFDNSAAPSKDCASMTQLYEEMGVEYFGAAGTVEVSSLLTKVFKSIQCTQLVGFSGLMLALTEDSGLAKGSQRGDFDIRALLTYSSVCGIGLDTVPIPGSTSVEKIASLMRDTGTMAFRLNKPLTVRVFPVPGLNAGDLTEFESDDLCNCAVLAVP